MLCSQLDSAQAQNGDRVYDADHIKVRMANVLRACVTQCQYCL
jgi:hypothetical protein